MANDDSNEDERGLVKDKYAGSGMHSFEFGITPNVMITAGAGAVLGLVLAMWGTSDVGIIAATVIVFAILSAIFGMFV